MLLGLGLGGALVVVVLMIRRRHLAHLAHIGRVMHEGKPSLIRYADDVRHFADG